MGQKQWSLCMLVCALPALAECGGAWEWSGPASSVPDHAHNMVLMQFTHNHDQLLCVYLYHINNQDGSRKVGTFIKAWLRCSTTTPFYWSSVDAHPIPVPCVQCVSHFKWLKGRGATKVIVGVVGHSAALLSASLIALCFCHSILQLHSLSTPCFLFISGIFTPYSGLTVASFHQAWRPDCFTQDFHFSWDYKWLKSISVGTSHP